MNHSDGDTGDLLKPESLDGTQEFPIHVLYDYSLLIVNVNIFKLHFEDLTQDPKSIFLIKKHYLF